MINYNYVARCIDEFNEMKHTWYIENFGKMDWHCTKYMHPEVEMHAAVNFLTERKPCCSRSIGRYDNKNGLGL